MAEKGRFNPSDFLRSTVYVP